MRLQETVAAHVDLVYAAAIRQVRDPHLADDITQTVFLLLARKLDRMDEEMPLAPWLIKATRYTALAALRADRRRRHHETGAGEAAFCETTEQHDQDIADLLDEALMALAETDRRLIILRYMQGRTIGEAAAALRLRGNTASKRIERALERMRVYFRRRGVSAGASALPGAIAAVAIKHAPPALAEQITMAIASAGNAASAAAISSISVGGAMMTTTTQIKVAAAVILLAALFGGGYLLFRPGEGPGPAGGTGAGAEALSDATASKGRPAAAKRVWQGR